jgi:zinc D-Ala-D-Ala dipeptidase
MSLRIPSPFRKIYATDNVHIHNLYASHDNFTLQPLPGYLLGELWLHEDAYRSFEHVVSTIKKMGLSLVVWDAYRPQSATKKMVDWAAQTNQYWLVEEGYIAGRSRHNGGVAIDIGLIKADSYLDMGTEWDDFSEKSHIQNVEGIPLQNRMLLQGVMSAHGWVGYSKEWWHFELPNAAQYPPYDILYT